MMKKLWSDIENLLFDREYKSWQVFLIFLLLAFIIFSPSFLNLNFFWDDERFLFLNPTFLKVENPIQFWNTRSPFFKSWPLGYSVFWVLNKYSPDQSFIFYKSLNIIFHAINGFLIFKLIKKLNFRFSLVASLIFLLHPLQVETVSWMFQFLTILSFTFFLLALIFSLRFVKEERYLFIFTSLFFFLMSLWTKSTSILFPILLVFLFFMSKVRFYKYLLLIPFFGLSFYIGVWNITGSKILTNQPIDQKSPVIQAYNFIDRRLPRFFDDRPITLKEDDQKLFFDYTYNKPKVRTAFRYSFREIFNQAGWHYFEKIAFPIDLNFIYPSIAYNYFLTAIALFIFFIFPFFAYKKIDHRLLLLTGISCAFLVPYLGVTDISFFYWSNVSDRYMYAFLLFPSLLMVAALEKKSEKMRVFSFFVIFFLSMKTITHGLFFNNPLVLYEKIIETKKHPVTYSLLFEQYYLNSDLKNAKKTLEEGRSKFPEDPQLKDDVYRLNNLIRSDEQLNRPQ